MKTICAFVLGAVVSVTMAASVPGCTPAQAANVIDTIDSYLRYVSTFVQGAQVVWSVIAPLLGTSQAAATAEFNRALASLTDAQVATEDALAAARAANQATPDLSAFLTSIQAAVAQVMDVVQKYSKPAGVGASVSTLAHQATVIASWH
jgi:hypothetical protein